MGQGLFSSIDNRKLRYQQDKEKFIKWNRRLHRTPEYKARAKAREQVIRAFAKEIGHCHRCLKEKEDNGFKSCNRCLIRYRGYYHKRKGIIKGGEEAIC